jgi:hypothetical protein
MSTKQDVILASDAPAPAFSFADMQRMAVAIAKSGLFGVKDADQALSLMMIAQAEGKHPALIARDYDVIQGRPAKKSEAILRDFQASGGRVEWHQRDDKGASATFSHPLAPKPVKIDWDLARAKQAGLMDKNGGMYVKYPRQMLSARCISEGCRAIAPSATSGFYTPEETRDMEAPAPAQPVNAAIAQAAQAPDPNEVEAYVNSMDVASLPALQAAFEAAWKSTKDVAVRARYKACYESMKGEIADAQARDAAEQS